MKTKITLGVLISICMLFAFSSCHSNHNDSRDDAELYNEALPVHAFENWICGHYKNNPVKTVVTQTFELNSDSTPSSEEGLILIKKVVENYTKDYSSATEIETNRMIGGNYSTTYYKYLIQDGILIEKINPQDPCCKMVYTYSSDYDYSVARYDLIEDGSYAPHDYSYTTTLDSHYNTIKVRETNSLKTGGTTLTEYFKPNKYNDYTYLTCDTDVNCRKECEYHKYVQNDNWTIRKVKSSTKNKKRKVVTKYTMEKRTIEYYN